MSVKGRVHLYVGDDEFAVRTAASGLIDSLVPEADRAFGLEVVEGLAGNSEEALVSIKRCEEAFLTRGFLMTGAKVVWWRNVTFLAEGQTAQADEVKAKVKVFAQMLKEVEGEGNILVMTAPKVDRRSMLFKVCSDRYSLREFAIPEKSAEAGRYAQATVLQELTARGLRANRDVVERFLERTGADSRQIAGEMEKLSLYVHGRRDITVDDVDAIVSASAESAMWDIQDAVGHRELGRSLRILRRLLDQRENPIGIVTMILNRLKELQVYREALDRGWLQFASGGKMAEWGGMEAEVEAQVAFILRKSPRSLHPYRAGILARQAQLYSSAMLRRALQQVMAAQETLVSSSVPPAIVLELLLTRLLTEGRTGPDVRPVPARMGLVSS